MKLSLRTVLAGSCVASAATVLVTCGPQSGKQPPPVPPPPLQAAPAQPVSSDLAAHDNGGGCYPNAYTSQPGYSITDLSDVNPSWVPVVNGTSIDSTPILLHGTVVHSHGDTGGDFPENHTSSDVVTDVQLIPADKNFAATGNDTPGVIALEWESGSLAAFAWPSAGDQVAAMGRWIFDCGHPNNNSMSGHCSTNASTPCFTNAECTGGTCQGAHFFYNSEMHPPYALAVSRLGRGGVVSTAANATPTLATRTDVFVSPNGGAAGDRCVVTHVDNSDTFLTAHDCYPLSQPIVDAYFNTWDFQFDIPLPARPANATMSWRVVAQPTPGGVPAQIVLQPDLTATPPTLHGVVKLSAKTNGKWPTGYAATIFAGWDAPPPTPLTHIQVTLDRVTIANPLQPQTPVGKVVKDWVLEASINGEAQRLTGLDSISAGSAVPQTLVFDQYLPPDGSVHLYVEGTVHSCIDTLFGQSFEKDASQLSLTDLPKCLFTDDPDPGDVDITYAGPDFGTNGSSRSYDSPSENGQGGYCSATTTQPCLGNSDCPSGESCTPAPGAFSVHYTIRKVP